MNSNYKSQLTNTKIKNFYYLILLIIVIYSCYKNGYLAYQKNLINIFEVFKPLFLVLSSYGLAILVDYIYLKYHKKHDIKNIIINSYNSLYAVLLALIIPINTPLIIFYIFLVAMLIMLQYKKNTVINYVVITKLLISLTLFLLNKYSYSNIYELNVITSYTTLDLFFGRVVGAIGTTNIFYILVSYIFLTTLITYKKEIPINILLSYLIIMFIFSIFQGNIIDSLKLLLQNELIFAAIFIATIPSFSPIKPKEQMYYAILIGILSYFLCKVSLKEGSYLAILISNIILIGFASLKLKMDKTVK